MPIYARITEIRTAQLSILCSVRRSLLDAFPMKPSHLLLAIVVMFVWGCSFVVAKNAIAEIPPMLFMAIRYVITAIVLLPFMWREKSRLGPVFGISVTLGFLHFAFGFTGLSGVDASVAVMLMQMQVPFAALLAVVL